MGLTYWVRGWEKRRKGEREKRRKHERAKGRKGEGEKRRRDIVIRNS
jgi:hypothetical protein